MNLTLWTAMREYLAAEIKLSHLRPKREAIRNAEHFDYRQQNLDALAEAIAEQEEQSTRMETEVRRLIERLPQLPANLGPELDAPLELGLDGDGDRHG